MRALFSLSVKLGTASLIQLPVARSPVCRLALSEYVSLKSIAGENFQSARHSADSSMAASASGASRSAARAPPSGRLAVVIVIRLFDAGDVPGLVIDEIDVRAAFQLA